MTARSKKIRLVLVDDHSVMRHGLATMLQQCSGFEVVGEASDGKSGVDMVRELTPDVVLVDINMPVMDGIEATRIIHSELPDTIVIALSMFPEIELGAVLREAGAAAYVCKTDPPENLIAVIRACIKKP